MRRRDFLLGTGAAGLAAVALHGGRSARATDRALQPRRRLLLVFAAGGWDTAYALDPKEPPLVDVPAGAVQRFGGLDIFTDASRPNVTRYFERHAAHTAIVRGIATDGIFHNECQRRIATGKRDEGQPDIGAMVAHDLGNALPIPYLILGDIAFTGPYAVSAARIGTTNQIVELLDSAGPAGPVVPVAPVGRVGRIGPVGPVAPVARVGRVGPVGPVRGPTARSTSPAAGDSLAATEDALLRRYAAASVERARATRGATGYNRRRVDDFAKSVEHSERLRQLRDRFGGRGETQSLTSQIPLALDALQQDISHAVMLTTRLGWDTHVDNHFQADHHETTFGALAPLIDQLTLRPGRSAGSKMIDDTVVVVFSELSRTPLAGGDPAHRGKEHWPVTSALVIGAGTKGGQVFGATTPDSRGLPIDLATGQPSPTGMQPMYSHFVAGLLALCGADPSAHFATTPVFDAFLA